MKTFESFINATVNSVNNVIKTEKNDEGITFHILAAGYEKDEIDISIQNYYMTIKGKPKENNAIHTHLNSMFHLGNLYDYDSVEATLDKGVLSVKLKNNPKTNKKVNVN
jgi:HSP20 family molecular chaperone IbpA